MFLFIILLQLTSTLILCAKRGNTECVPLHSDVRSKLKDVGGGEGWGGELDLTSEILTSDKKG